MTEVIHTRARSEGEREGGEKGGKGRERKAGRERKRGKKKEIVNKIPI